MRAASLDGCRVVLTRPAPGRLAEILRGLGAIVEHVPLIEIGDASDGGRAVAAWLDRIDEFDWLVVTSTNGAQRVGAAARSHRTRLAAVGTATAAVLAELAGRPVDLVPKVQHTGGLLAEFPPGAATVLLAQGNLASDELADGLRDRGCDVTAVEAYSTRHRPPSIAELERLGVADVVVVSSGSAIDAWIAAEPSAIRVAVVAIGPKTAAAATGRGVPIAAVAASPSDDDVVDAIVHALSADQP